jgi:hypothetical protein
MKLEKLNKDNELKKTIDLLIKKYGDWILIMDFWEADLCAIGLCDIAENLLIYISTYSLPPGKYNIVLEDISVDKYNPSVIREYNDIKIEKIEEILIEYFNIK